MAEILLVRHGALEMNEPPKFWGKSDINLSAEGIKQAEQLRDRLASKKIDAAYSSTLKRTRQTGEIICAPHNLPVTASPFLDEIFFGDFEGFTFDQIKETDPEVAKLLMVWDIQPRFPHGESMDELNERVKKFIGTTDLTGDKTILIAAHAGTLRMLICNLLGLEIKHWRKLRLNFGSLSIVHTYQDLCILTVMNDICHQGNFSD